MVILLFGGGILGIIPAYYSSKQTVEITVKSKERIVESHGETTTSKYLVGTQGEVFENTDDLFLGKFDSSDLQNTLDPDSTYTVEVIGWRIPFFSMYRNIVEIKSPS